ncbi:MAG: DUF362 domain-containing protein [Deltaproteobacteria bacterium]|nr:MAG: DUF362 domain-containing protein [Deltaproteobacteria bacterium]
MSTVYYVTLDAKPERNLLRKFEVSLEIACEGEIVSRKDLVAVKLHFGERGNLAFVRHQFVRTVVDIIKKKGGKPFLTDTNTLYVGSRSCAPDHILTALYNGFGVEQTGAPVVIADGLRGESKVRIPIEGETTKEAVIGSEIYAADAMITITHFKGHELSGFGGTIKNLGMGCAAREGKLFQHSTVSPFVDPEGCIACGKCVAVCPGGAIAIVDGKAHISSEACIGCADCIVICPEGTIKVNWNEASESVMKKMAEYALGAVKGKEGKVLFINFITQVSPYCDCYGFNDVPIAPDVGICLSTDPVAVDQASVDLVLEKMGGEDPFRKTHPHIDWEIQLAHAEKIGLGSRSYELKKIE